MPPRPVNRAPPAAVRDAIETPTAYQCQYSISLLPALSPAYVNDEGINFSTSDGMKLYNASIASFPRTGSMI
jgi:hypothetical protein